MYVVVIQLIMMDKKTLSWDKGRRIGSLSFIMWEFSIFANARGWICLLFGPGFHLEM